MRLLVLRLLPTTANPSQSAQSAPGFAAHFSSPSAPSPYWCILVCSRGGGGWPRWGLPPPIGFWAVWAWPASCGCGGCWGQSRFLACPWCRAGWASCSPLATPPARAGLRLDGHARRWRGAWSAPWGSRAGGRRHGRAGGRGGDAGKCGRLGRWQRRWRGGEGPQGQGGSGKKKSGCV